MNSLPLGHVTNFYGFIFISIHAIAMKLDRMKDQHALAVVVLRATSATFKPKFKTHPEKNSLHFRKRNFGSNIKKILMFSRKKAFLIFSQMKPCTFHLSPFHFLHFSHPNFSYIFSKRKLFLCFGKRGPPKNTLYFRM